MANSKNSNSKFNKGYNSCYDKVMFYLNQEYDSLESQMEDSWGEDRYEEEDYNFLIERINCVSNLKHKLHLYLKNVPFNSSGRYDYEEWNKRVDGTRKEWKTWYKDHEDHYNKYILLKQDN